jgi:hypothetical protein
VVGFSFINLEELTANSKTNEAISIFHTQRIPARVA